jgi:hypothetical protein
LRTYLQDNATTLPGGRLAKNEYYYQGRLSMTKKESRLQQVTTRQEVKVHCAKAEELMTHLDPMVETM